MPERLAFQILNNFSKTTLKIRLDLFCRHDYEIKGDLVFISCAFDNNLSLKELLSRYVLTRISLIEPKDSVNFISSSQLSAIVSKNAKQSNPSSITNQVGYTRCIRPINDFIDSASRKSDQFPSDLIPMILESTDVKALRTNVQKFILTNNLSLSQGIIDFLYNSDSTGLWITPNYLEFIIKDLVISAQEKKLIRESYQECVLDMKEYYLHSRNERKKLTNNYLFQKIILKLSEKYMNKDTRRLFELSIQGFSNKALEILQFSLNELFDTVVGFNPVHSRTKQ